jgi:hypothetical protein
MAKSRAPLMELSSQVHNRRKMSARQKTYGKHRRAVAAQAPIWETPGDEGNALEKSTTPPGWPLLDIDNQLAAGVGTLAIASHENAATLGFAEIDSQNTPDLAVKVDSQNSSTVPKHALEKVSSTDTPNLARATIKEFESQPTSTFTKHVLENFDSQNTSTVSKRVFRKANSTNTTAVWNPILWEVDSQGTPAPAKPAEPTKFLPKKRVTRRNDKIDSLPIQVDVSALLKESFAHTKSPTKTFVEVINFQDFAAKLNKQFAIKKLSDGSFGDVYKLITHSSTKTSSKNRLEQLGGGVLKIIPLASTTGFGSRKFSRVENVLSEVKVLRRLDALHGFTRFRDVHVVQGRYPDSFVDAYVEFGKEVRQSDAPNPVNFTESQRYAIIDMDDAGSDLESLTEPNIFQIHDIFWAAAIVLAHGENTVEFEARDMHVGNICIRPFIRNGTMNVPGHQLSGWSKTQVRHLGLTEIRVTLIDYTLSRARMKNKSVAFVDLEKNKFLFPKPGQEPVNIQQRAYVQMRDAVRAASAAASTSKKEDWSLFVPRTNIAWLSYLLATLLERLDHKVPEGSNETCVQAQQVMLGKLQVVLRKLEEGASGGNGEDAGFGSAGELLEGALGSGCLRREEVEWYVQQLESEL